MAKGDIYCTFCRELIEGEHMELPPLRKSKFVRRYHPSCFKRNRAVVKRKVNNVARPYSGFQDAR